MTVQASPYIVAAAERVGISHVRQPKPRWMIELRQGDRIIGDIEHREVYDTTWEIWEDKWSWRWLGRNVGRLNLGADCDTLEDAQRAVAKLEAEFQAGRK